LSLQNEVDVALSRGQRWLINRQLEDGSWPGTNNVEITAAAWLALSAVEFDEGKSVLAKGWRWLEKQTNATDYAWLRLAHAAHKHDIEAINTLCNRMLDEQRQLVNAEPLDILLMWLTARQRNQKLAKLPPSDDTGNEANWRETVARYLINKQQADLEFPGAAFWSVFSGKGLPEWQNQAIAQTCFALLMLQEL
jgi:phenylpropionate dioxygenase-like ring-hydroxylating dioxygenase large terminal subunit